MVLFCAQQLSGSVRDVQRRHMCASGHLVLGTLPSHLSTLPPPCCRYNQLGPAGAEELVKRDWPELRTLDVGWGGLAVLLCAQQCTMSMSTHEPMYACVETCKRLFICGK
jgi:hypothetical protein